MCNLAARAFISCSIWSSYLIRNCFQTKPADGRNDWSEHVCPQKGRKWKFSRSCWVTETGTEHCFRGVVISILTPEQLYALGQESGHTSRDQGEDQDVKDRSSYHFSIARLSFILEQRYIHNGKERHWGSSGSMLIISLIQNELLKSHNALCQVMWYTRWKVWPLEPDGGISILPLARCDLGVTSLSLHFLICQKETIGAATSKAIWELNELQMPCRRWQVLSDEWPLAPVWVLWTQFLTFPDMNSSLSWDCPEDWNWL